MEKLTRRAFTAGVAAAIPFGGSARDGAPGGRGAASLSPLPDENAGQRVLRRPCPLDPKREISTLGLGGVRIPVLSGKLGSQTDPIDYPAASRLVDYAIAHGINWFDSGYIYHQGDSEKFFGHALSKHPRESFWFCTKAPPWNITTLADAKRIFAEQLQRCRMKYFDVYMLHSLIREEDYERTFVKTGVIDYLLEEKAKGRIKYLGFSFHGREAFLDRLLAERPWDVVTILMNGVDFRGANRSESLLAKLRAKKVPAIGMESLAGGRLARLRPDAHALLKKARPELTDAAWSLKFAAEQPGMVLAMTGFTKFEHLKEDIATFDAKNYRPLSEADRKTYLDAIKLEVGGGEGVPCSECKYCMPCPYGIDIPGIFHWWNMAIKWGRLPSPADPADHDHRIGFLNGYYKLVGRFRGADRCIGCGRCEKKCPQWQFNIPKELARIDSFVESLLKTEYAYRRPC